MLTCGISISSYRNSTFIGQPGVSNSNGTLGCFITPSLSGYLGVYMLTNFHVISKDLTDNQGLSGYQVYHGINLIGTPVHGLRDQTHDCVIVKISNNTWQNTVTVKNNLQVELVNIDDPKEGDMVFKVGRSTGYTEGKIVGVKLANPKINSRIRKNLGITDKSTAFGIQPMKSSFAEQGDSGAVIVRESDNKVVGLLFGNKEIVDPYGNNKSGTYGVAFNIRSQFDIFGDATRLSVPGDRLGG